MGGKRNSGLVALLVVFIILTMALGGYLIYDKVINKNSTNTPNNAVNKENSENNNVNTDSSVDASSITTEIQSVYDNAYETIADGSGLYDYNAVNIQVGEEGTVGGVIDVKAYKFDYTKLEPYFTDRAINFVKFYFTDTPYGYKDGNYYIYETENKYSYDKKEFMNTIFGATDQSKRTLKVKFYNDDMVVAVSEKTSFIPLDEYIIFKKVNNSWKIDMFEEF